MGSPIADWLQEWCRDVAPQLAIATTRRLIGRRRAVEVLDVEISRPDRGSERWLISESHWADCFTAPSYGRFLLWTSGAVPWAALWLIGGGFVAAGDTIRDAERWLDDMGGFWPFLRRHVTHPFAILEGLARILGPLAAALLDIVFRLLGLVALFPLAALAAVIGVVPAWRRGAADLLGTLGDSFAFVAFDDQGAAMRRRIQGDIDALRERCQRIVIVAHSQGAAVVHDVLRRSRTTPDCTFISVGSGVAALRGLTALRESTAAWSLIGTALTVFTLLGEAEVGYAAAPAFVQLGRSVLVALGAGLLISRELTADAWYYVDWSAIGHLRGAWVEYLGGYVRWSTVNDIQLLVTTAITLVPIGLTNYWLRSTGAIPAWKRDVPIVRKGRRRVRWVDVFTARDPVPIGRLTHQLVDDSIEVVNLASLVRDHNAYASNRHDVGPRIVREAARDGRFHRDIFPPARELELARASRARAARVRRIARWGDVAAFAGIATTIAAIRDAGARGAWIAAAASALALWLLARRRVRHAACRHPLRETDAATEGGSYRIWPYALAGGALVLVNLGLVTTIENLPGEDIPMTGRALHSHEGILVTVAAAAVLGLAASGLLLLGQRRALWALAAAALVASIAEVLIWPLAAYGTLVSVAILGAAVYGLRRTGRPRTTTA